MQARADWVGFVGLPVQLLRGGVGGLGQAVEPFVAHWVGADGTWDDGRDTGLRFSPEAAVSIVSAQVTPAGGPSAEVTAGIRSAYLTTAARLGVPAPPVSPTWDARGALLDDGPGVGDVRDAATGLLRSVEGFRGGPR